ncbi:MAG: type II secretion system F family protein [Patescibacteria group bacterium]
MPIYKYKAKNNYGETVTGKVEAQLRDQAFAVLKDRGLFVIEVHEANEGGNIKIPFLGGIKQDDVIGYTRQLSTMITAGLSLLDALTILERQSKPAMRKLIADIKREIEGGTSFAEALSKHKQFSRVYQNLVRAGEAAGVLSEVLARMADSLEKEKEFRGKVKGALIYPAIVMSAMFIVATVMMIFVIPQLSSMYKDFGADLPLITQILISTSEIFQSYWYIIFAVLGGSIFGIVKWRQTPQGQHMFDSYLLKVPIFGILQQKIILTEFARTLSLLLGAGISLLEALEIVAESMDNVVYREAIKEAYGYVEKGSSLATAIEQYKFFPPILAQMISVGEETGQLDDVLLKLSHYFETESEQAVKGLTTAIEPLIMIVLGLGVGFLVVAIVMPIYSLTSQF